MGAVAMNKYDVKIEIDEAIKVLHIKMDSDKEFKKWLKIFKAFQKGADLSYEKMEKEEFKL
jgi:hypothetical protein